MFISKGTLDDLLRRVFEVLLTRGRTISPGKGKASELVGVLLELRNPLARLSRTERRSLLFSCLGELLWYLSGDDSDKFIRYYLPNYPVTPDKHGKIASAYGPRLINRKAGINQLENIIRMLRDHTDSRRAVIQVFEAKDAGEHYPEVPCTCTMQFLLRRGRLHMLVNMRSNDAFTCLPADIFAFTMLQEIIAKSVGAELGSYRHCVGSLHLYEADKHKASRLLEEGWQSRISMPPMPLGDPWPNIRRVLSAERRARNGTLGSIPESIRSPYWRDLVRLLQIYHSSETGDSSEVRRLRRAMSTDVFNIYIEKRHRRAMRVAADNGEPIQQELFRPQ
jgi:thymidylate synthase